ncbi:MAG: CoA pyrophosphatase [Ignavibacteriales bacterium]|jgi:8-oxo-dGTP pyrophosphatase MutT (NUDIX family)|nr:MAG: CoA pyrophosphatase [Ignavibacteriales bacterium]
MDYLNTLGRIVVKNCSIIGKDQYINSAVLIPIIVIDKTEFVLFQKRSSTVRQPGEVSFPGGHFNSRFDNDFLSTATRETCEELGIEKDKISVLGKIGTLVAPMGVIVEAYLGILNINSLDVLKIDHKEVDRIFVIPLEYFISNKPDEYFTRLELHPFMTKEDGEKVELLPVKELGLPEKYSIPWTNGKHRVLVYRTSEEVIWGITAELIFELSTKLKEQIDKQL